jgi:hypothetical protein
MQLADALDDEFTQGRISNYNGRKAAAELRRLHEVNQDLLASVVELLNCIQPDRDWHEAKRARATIAKATGEKA